MKTGIFVGLVFFVSATLLAAAEIYQPVSVTPPEPPREFRGAWITTVANKDWPSSPGLTVTQQKAELISLLDTAVRLKLNAVVFQVRSSCDAMYASPIEPWSEYLTGVQGRPPQPFYDPLAFAIEEAHKRGLELHAWFNPFRARFSQAVSPEAPNHVSRLHPEFVRKYGDQLWLDPGEPGAREHVLRVIMDVVRRYDVDGVQFDDYFYPYAVKSGEGILLPFPDDVSWKEFGAQSGLSRDDWRRQNINQFIQRVYQNIKAVKPRVKFGVSPFGIWRPGYPPQITGLDVYASLFADSRLWLASGWLDYFSPQLYWPINSPGQSFPVLLNWWSRQNVRGRNLWPGLAASRAGADFPATEIARQIQAIRAQPGASGEIFFRLRNFQENPALAGVVAGQYTQSALVPASPWLDPTLPARPTLTVNTSSAGWSFQWTSREPAAGWILQFCGPARIWATEILPANQTGGTFPVSPPDILSIRAVDRVGNLSPPAALGKIGASSSGNGTGSYWRLHRY